MVNKHTSQGNNLLVIQLCRRGVQLKNSRLVHPIASRSRFFLLWFPAFVVKGDDWWQWRGPDRNGVCHEVNLLQHWNEGETPEVAWRASVGKGHSAVSVADGRAYTMGWDGSQDTVYCFDAATGKPIWSQSYPCETILQWPGPRSTPTFHDGAVFTLGRHGQLRA